MFDQAQRLRNLVAAYKGDGPAARVIAVSSGKGGVGKSNFTLNLALGLCAKGNRVVILDADVGFANIDVLLGVSAKKNLQDLLGHSSTIWDILQNGPAGLQFIAGGSGLSDLLTFGDDDLQYLMSQLGELQGYADYVLIDTGAGLNPTTLQFILSADDLIVVTTPEPTSITDAYALIKLVANRGLGEQVKLVVNRIASRLEGDETADKLRLVAKRFLKLDLAVLGYVPDDVHVSRAVRSQRPFYLQYPESSASRSIDALSAKLLERQPVAGVGRETGVKAFLSRMVKLFR